MYRLFLILLSWIALVNGDCIESDVYMLFRDQIIPNNSYVLFQCIARYDQGRVYCYSNNIACCGPENSEWYLPNGEPILGGYEYLQHNLTATDKFIRSHDRNLHNVALFHFSNPSQRGRFWCELPDSNGTKCTLFVNIVNDIPEIIGQPISQTVLSGEDVTFMIHISLNDFAVYQWQKNNVSMIDKPGNYHGAASSSLTLFNVHEWDEGDYWCVIDNYLVSNAAELSVGKLASIIILL